MADRVDEVLADLRRDLDEAEDADDLFMATPEDLRALVGEIDQLRAVVAERDAEIERLRSRPRHLPTDATDEAIVDRLVARAIKRNDADPDDGKGRE